MKVLYGLQTAHLKAGDLVIMDLNEVVEFASYKVTNNETGYGEITWRDPDNHNITWTTTAQYWNDWPIVIRNG